MNKSEHRPVIRYDVGTATLYDTVNSQQVEGNSLFVVVSSRAMVSQFEHNGYTEFTGKPNEDHESHRWVITHIRFNLTFGAGFKPNKDDTVVVLETALLGSTTTKFSRAFRHTNCRKLCVTEGHFDPTKVYDIAVNLGFTGVFGSRRQFQTEFFEGWDHPRGFFVFCGMKNIAEMVNRFRRHSVGWPDEPVKEPDNRTLRQKGYRYISRRHRIVARVDRPDWREHMATRHSPSDPEGAGMRWVKALGGDAANHYRRCYSEDRIETSTFFKSVGNSSGDKIGYVE